MLAKFWRDQGGRSLGIVGDVKHQQKGTSYHLGKYQLKPDAYSRRLRRDREGLTERASALDLGKLNKQHREAAQVLELARGTGRGRPDPRYPGDHLVPGREGRAALGRAPGPGIPSLRRDKNGVIHIINDGNGDETHFWHTHISFYRDSRVEPKVLYFRPFFEHPIPPKPDDEPEPNPDDDLDRDPDDEGDPKPDDGPVLLFVRVKPFPHPRSTLSGIAREFDMTLKQLLAFPENKKFRDNPGLVHAGQKVRVR